MACITCENCEFSDSSTLDFTFLIAEGHSTKSDCSSWADGYDAERFNGGDSFELQYQSSSVSRVIWRATDISWEVGLAPVSCDYPSSWFSLTNLDIEVAYNCSNNEWEFRTSTTGTGSWSGWFILNSYRSGATAVYTPNIIQEDCLGFIRADNVICQFDGDIYSCALSDIQIAVNNNDVCIDNSSSSSLGFSSSSSSLGFSSSSSSLGFSSSSSLGFSSSSSSLGFSSSSSDCDVCDDCLFSDISKIDFAYQIHSCEHTSTEGSCEELNAASSVAFYVAGELEYDGNCEWSGSLVEYLNTSPNFCGTKQNNVIGWVVNPAIPVKVRYGNIAGKWEYNLDNAGWDTVSDPSQGCNGADEDSYTCYDDFSGGVPDYSDNLWVDINVLNNEACEFSSSSSSSEGLSSSSSSLGLSSSSSSLGFSSSSSSLGFSSSSSSLGFSSSSSSLGLSSSSSSLGFSSSSSSSLGFSSSSSESSECCDCSVASGGCDELPCRDVCTPETLQVTVTNSGTNLDGNTYCLTHTNRDNLPNGIYGAGKTNCTWGLKNPHEYSEVNSGWVVVWFDSGSWWFSIRDNVGTGFVLNISVGFNCCQPFTVTQASATYDFESCCTVVDFSSSSSSSLGFSSSSSSLGFSSSSSSLGFSSSSSSSLGFSSSSSDISESSSSSSLGFSSSSSSDFSGSESSQSIFSSSESSDSSSSILESSSSSESFEDCGHISIAERPNRESAILVSNDIEYDALVYHSIDDKVFPSWGVAGTEREGIESTWENITSGDSAFMQKQTTTCDVEDIEKEYMTINAEIGTFGDLKCNEDCQPAIRSDMILDELLYYKKGKYIVADGGAKEMDQLLPGEFWTDSVNFVWNDKKQYWEADFNSSFPHIKNMSINWYDNNDVLGFSIILLGSCCRFTLVENMPTCQGCEAFYNLGSYESSKIVMQGSSELKDASFEASGEFISCSTFWRLKASGCYSSTAYNTRGVLFVFSENIDTGNIDCFVSYDDAKKWYHHKNIVNIDESSTLSRPYIIHDNKNNDIMHLIFVLNDLVICSYEIDTSLFRKYDSFKDSNYSIYGEKIRSNKVSVIDGDVGSIQFTDDLIKAYQDNEVSDIPYNLSFGYNAASEDDSNISYAAYRDRNGALRLWILMENKIHIRSSYDGINWHRTITPKDFFTYSGNIGESKPVDGSYFEPRENIQTIYDENTDEVYVLLAADGGLALRRINNDVVRLVDGIEDGRNSNSGYKQKLLDRYFGTPDFSSANPVIMLAGDLISSLYITPSAYENRKEHRVRGISQPDGYINRNGFLKIYYFNEFREIWNVTLLPGSSTPYV